MNSCRHEWELCEDRSGDKPRHGRGCRKCDAFEEITGWQPIETYPVDRPIVDVWTEMRGRETDTFYCPIEKRWKRWGFNPMEDGPGWE